jgi:multimeric flavodoxin WrbA
MAQERLEVLGINGSPHADGNTHAALAYALSLLAERGIRTRYEGLAGKSIRPCDGCFRCRSGACAHDDDMSGLYAALRECRCLLLASPVYMGMPTGQMKVMMDRAVALRVRGGAEFEMSGKIGAGIACGGFRNGGQELTLQCMHTFFLQLDMLAMADGPRFSHSGAAIVGRTDQDELGRQTIENLAARIARHLRPGSPVGT